jgi:asparagine N-glycosylation enzyme membrane subunit Stt3
VIQPDDLLLPFLAVVTSAAAGALGARYLRLPARGLGRALGFLLDVLGLTVVFFAANGAVGIVVVLALRHVMGRFASVHTIDDVALAVLSLLQALLFQSWRAAGRANDD